MCGLVGIERELMVYRGDECPGASYERGEAFGE